MSKLRSDISNPAGENSVPLEATTGRERASSISRSTVLYAAALAAVFALGGLLRVYNFNLRPLWNDEGFTVLYTRMSWPDVVGLHGYYDIHPPLYYVLVKLTGLFAPEQVAGRLLSVVVGALTILVLFELTRRLLNTTAAIIAALVLAISPIHVWYSQEARQTAPTLLAVAISYLALVAYRQSPRLGWAIVYGVSTGVAMYLDYSALFALAPQIVLLALVAREQARRSLPLFIALALAVLAYLPWIPQAIMSTTTEGTTRAGYLNLSGDRFLAAASALVGLQDQGDYFQRDLAALWQMWDPLHFALIAAAVVAIVSGVMVGWKRSRPALLVAALLGLGTIACASLASLVSPSFAARTMIAAVLGWAILLGMLIRGTSGRWRWVGAAVLVVVFAVSVICLYAANDTFSLQRGPRWPELSTDISKIREANPDFRIVVPSKVDYVLLDVYKPGVLDGKAMTALDDLGKLPQSKGNVWMAYHHSLAFTPYLDELARLGYVRAGQTKYLPGGLLLEQYKHP